MSWGSDDDYFGDGGGGGGKGSPGAGAPSGRPDPVMPTSGRAAPRSWSGGTPTAAIEVDAPVRPAVWLLLASTALALGGLAASLLQLGGWPGLVAAWLFGGVLALVLVVWFVHTDIRRRATGLYLASSATAALQTAAMLLAVAAVVLAAVRFALLAGHGGVW